MITRMSAAIEAFEESLDDAFGDPDGMIEVACGLRYQPSRILRDVDPVAYRQVFSEWADAMELDTDDLEADAGLPL